MAAWGARYAGEGRRRVAAVDRDVEAGLVELLFHVDLAGGLQGQEPGTHPRDLGLGQALLADVDGGSRQVRRGEISVSGGGVAVHQHQGPLEIDGPYGRVDLQRAVEALIVAAGQVAEEVRGPWAAVAAVVGKSRIDSQRGAGGEDDQLAGGAHGVELGIVLNPDEAFGGVALILAEQRLARSAQRRHEGDAGKRGDGRVPFGRVRSQRLRDRPSLCGRTGRCGVIHGRGAVQRVAMMGAAGRGGSAAGMVGGSVPGMVDRAPDWNVSRRVSRRRKTGQSQGQSCAQCERGKQWGRYTHFRGPRRIGASSFRVADTSAGKK